MRKIKLLQNVTSWISATSSAKSCGNVNISHGIIQGETGLLDIQIQDVSRMRFDNRVIFLLFTIVLIVLRAVPALAEPLESKAHYFVIQQAVDGRLSIVSHQHVMLRGQHEFGRLKLQPNRLESHLSVSVHEKTTGNVLFDTYAISSPWLRGEFQGNDTIDGYILPVAEKQYVVRVPVIAGAMLRLKGGSNPGASTVSLDMSAAGETTGIEIDLDSYTAVTDVEMFLPPPLPVRASTGTLATNGEPANRLDLLIVAEGYTAAQQNQFVQDATNMVYSFLGISPYHDFRHLINVSWLFVPSNQAGADKPSCPETPGYPVVTVDTAFDATFCTSGIRRLVAVNTSKVLTAAAAVPDWDKILVLVNDTEYGGAGGTLSVATTHASSAMIMQHEFGHSFTLLADEYSSAYPGYPACSDLSLTSPCEANVTDQTDRNQLKWKDWVAAQTPVPTSTQLSNPLEAGLWAGARYQSAGMYRQCYLGIMRALGYPFCRVDSEAFVKRLYKGGWGLPSNGISLIELGSIPSGSNVSAPAQTDVLFSAKLAGSLPTGGLTVTWLVDNVAKKNAASSHGAQEYFTFNVPDAAAHTIELRVTDTTPFTLEPPTSSRVWTVTTTCTYTISPTSRSVVSSSSTNNTITVTPSSSSCAWTASSNATWLTVTSGSSGTGSGTVSYSVAANALSSSRTGTITVGGQTHTVTQSGIVSGGSSITTSFAGTYSFTGGSGGNMFDLSALSSALSINGFDFNITAAAGTVVPVNIYYKNGTYIGSELTSSAWTLLNSYSVTSAGLGLPSRVNVSGPTIPAGSTYGIYITTTNNTGSLQFTTGTGTYTNSDMELKLGSANNYPFAGTYTPYTWNGTIYYTTASPSCTYSISPTTAAFSSSSNTGTISVTPSSSSCAWTASSNATWITVTSGSSGTGSGTVTYSVAANTSTSSRTGTITVGGKTHTVTQSGASSCTYTITPTSQTVAASSSINTITVTPSLSSCTWTAASNATSWLTVTSGSSSTGSGTVSYSVAENSSTASRTGTITVANNTFTATQLGSGQAAARDKLLLSSSSGWTLPAFSTVDVIGNQVVQTLKTPSGVSATMQLSGADDRVEMCGNIAEYAISTDGTSIVLTRAGASVSFATNAVDNDKIAFADGSAIVKINTSVGGITLGGVYVYSNPALNTGLNASILNAADKSSITCQ